MKNEEISKYVGLTEKKGSLVNKEKVERYFNEKVAKHIGRLVGLDFAREIWDEFEKGDGPFTNSFEILYFHQLVALAAVGGPLLSDIRSKYE